MIPYPSCHWFGPHDPRCSDGCPPDCLGDFTRRMRFVARTTREGQAIRIGVCAFHGTAIEARKREGKVLVTHLVPWSPAAPARGDYGKEF